MQNGSVYDIIHKHRKKLTWAARLQVLQQTAGAMVYLHNFNPKIIHRDLKTQNILVDGSFHVKLCDFGMARSKETTASMTAIGTPQWAAPEVLKRDAYSEKADVYSFAIVVWEIVTHKFPYQGMSAIRVATEVATNDIRPEIPITCPQPLRQLMQACWATDVTARPTFQEIYKTLSDMPVPTIPT
eukprot:GFYU01021860.1.p1 GENE.GFYU01021860.1~~GFYU01021860.1.p1  ORF type:complete len:185 (-),score=31.86 GFYU01021860.1:69-623(-)